MTIESKNTKKAEQIRTEDNYSMDITQILVGNKQLMKYVTAIIMQIKKENKAIIKARGKFISKAVDAVEIVKKNLQEKEKKNLKNEIKVGTETFTNDFGKNINVSIIEIKLFA